MCPREGYRAKVQNLSRHLKDVHDSGICKKITKGTRRTSKTNIYKTETADKMPYSWCGSNNQNMGHGGHVAKYDRLRMSLQRLSNSQGKIFFQFEKSSRCGDLVQARGCTERFHLMSR